MPRIEPARPSASQVIQNRPKRVEPKEVKPDPVEPRKVAQHPSKGGRVDMRAQKECLIKNEKIFIDIDARFISASKFCWQGRVSYW